jgi:hypothetical protein
MSAEYGQPLRRYMVSPLANMGKPPQAVYVVQLEEATAEWRRRRSASLAGPSGPCDYRGQEGQMTKGPIGFHGTENIDPNLVDSWERNSPGKEISYEIRTAPSKLAYIYYCQIVEKMQGRSATETILGGE